MKPRGTDGSVTDEALLARFSGGDDSALGALAERHESRLLGLALGLCRGNESLAREAVQEAWVRVIRHARAFRGRSSFSTWVYRITINRCRDLNARERRASRPVAASSSSPDARDSSGVQEVEWLQTVLDRLDERGRETVILCHLRGMTHEQASAVLGIPVGTLKTRMRRAMRTLSDAAGSEAKR
ncbi:MAG TPA: hypothetical protein DEB06_04635 [Phycisphaerales bacterium]|nr:hypothetical protein [Phycisphaerales bacterium]